MATIYPALYENNGFVSHMVFSIFSSLLFSLFMTLSLCFSLSVFLSHSLSLSLTPLHFLSISFSVFMILPLHPTPSIFPSIQPDKWGRRNKKWINPRLSWHFAIFRILFLHDGKWGRTHTHTHTHTHIYIYIYIYVDVWVCVCVSVYVSACA